VRDRKLKKEERYNGRKKKDERYNGRKKKDNMTNNDLQNTTQKTKYRIEQRESHYAPGGAGMALCELDQLLPIGPMPTLCCLSTHNNTLLVLQRTTTAMQASPASLVKANFSLLGLHEYLPFSQFDDILNFSSEDIVCLANGCRHIS
jgi:hypothetical protein